MEIFSEIKGNFRNEVQNKGFFWLEVTKYRRDNQYFV